MVEFMKVKTKKLKIHSDERGWLAEILREDEIKEKIKQVYVATIEPGFVRGNHYHLKRKEWFFVLKGEGKLYLKDPKTRKKILKISEKTKRVVEISPKIIHAIKNTGKEPLYLISIQNDLYDPRNPDTFPEIICK
jgi:UDP-2-acetamido-2,6-beta-L-arabino-hexul-4-ose reductase